jgi:hypothetical protein
MYNVLHIKHTRITNNLPCTTRSIHVLPITYHVLHIKHTRITTNLPCATHVLCVVRGKLLVIRVIFICGTW